MIARRSILTGLVALVAAPAIVKVSSLMPVNAALQPGLNDWVREAGRLFLESNNWVQEVNARYMIEATKDGELRAQRVSDYEFYKGEQHSVDVLYGSTNPNLSSDDVKSLMERQYEAANDYVVDKWTPFESAAFQRRVDDYLNQVNREPVPAALGPLALAAAAVAVAPALLEKPVTRRFWSK